LNIEAVTSNRDGSESDLVRDLANLPYGRPDWLIDELRKMSDEAIFNRCIPLDFWPPSAEGKWVLLRIAPYVLLCQLLVVNAELYGLGLGQSILKVVRVVHDSAAGAMLDELRQQASDEEES
jgi:hypothetical protein